MIDITVRSEWMHVTGKLAVVTDVTSDRVACVYDRVDDPDGPAAQYGWQWFGSDQFLIEHVPSVDIPESAIA